MIMQIALGYVLGRVMWVFVVAVLKVVLKRLSDEVSE